MAKKTRREKELARLRREVEILRAQKIEKPSEIRKTDLPNTAETKMKASKSALPQADIKYIKADLLKTAILTVAAFGIIAVAYLLRNQIPYL